MSSFRSILGKGEKLLWEGQPPDGILLRKNDALFIPFSLIWAGFAVFWNVGVWASDAPLFFRLWGLPFLLVGAYITVGRLWVDRYRRRRTRYGVTNQRILIATGVGKTGTGKAGVGKSVRSLDIANLPALILDEDGNGTGTISFTHQIEGNFRNRLPLDPAAGPEFLGIANARKVYETIRRAQANIRDFGGADFAPLDPFRPDEPAPQGPDGIAASNIPRV